MISSSIRLGLQIALACLIGFALTSCASNPPAELPFAESNVEAVDVLDSNEASIAFEAKWVCERQRRTFGDLSQMDLALDEALAAEDISRETYDAFLAELSDSQVLRDAVLSQYEQRCQA